MRVPPHLARRSLGLAVATLVAAAGLIGVSGSPASAALCSSGSGVNVVVDFQGLGGGVQKGCDPSGAGKSASSVFPAAGFGLSYARAQPGFVCRVSGKPASDPCGQASPADAYWGLYWSDGKSGTWQYSSRGVGGLQVPAGGFVAFSWQNGGAGDPPGVAPRGVQATQPTPTPTKAATKAATKAPGKKPSSKKPTRKPTATAATAATVTPTPSASATATAAASSSASATPSPTGTASSASAAASAAASPSSSASASGEAAGDLDAVPASSATDDGGLPVWVPVGVLVVLGAVTGGVLLRRRSGGSGV